MADDVTVKLLNEAEVLRTIRALADQIGTEKRRPQKVIGIEGVKGIHQGFDTQTSPEGIPWRPNKSRSGKILQDHRILYHAITYQVSATDAVIGTNDQRARTLHYGGRIYPKKGRYLAILLPGTERRGPLRATWRDAFVLKLGGKDYGNDRLWLVQRQQGQQFTGGAKKNSYKVEGHGKLRFIALLVKWVDEPGRPFIGMSLPTQDNVVRRLEELARRAWETGHSADP